MRQNLVLPDLGLGEQPVTVSLWLVELGAEVTEGDRLVELASDSVTIDLPGAGQRRAGRDLGRRGRGSSGRQVLGIIDAVEE